MILDVSINDSECILINFYNANTEKEQIDILNNMFVLLEKFDTNRKKQLIMAGDFNLLFDSNLDAQGGNPTIKKKLLAKLFELKENYDLCDICRVENTKSKRFTFVQKHSSGFIQHRLDYMFISNTFQKLVTMTEKLTPISADHTPALFSLSKEKGCLRGKRIWKFDTSLTKGQDYITEIKK